MSINLKGLFQNEFEQNKEISWEAKFDQDNKPKANWEVKRVIYAGIIDEYYHIIKRQMSIAIYLNIIHYIFI